MYYCTLCNFHIQEEADNFLEENACSNTAAFGVQVQVTLVSVCIIREDNPGDQQVVLILIKI